jgi:hypothetical protein
VKHRPVVLLFVSLLCTRLAQAQAVAVPKQDVRLEYLADARTHGECPSSEGFAALVTGRTRLAVFVEGRARTARVEIHDTRTGATGSLRVEDFGPTLDPREVSGSSCAEVADALALTLALSIDPNASLRVAKLVKEPLPSIPSPAPAMPVPVPPPQASANTAPPSIPVPAPAVERPTRLAAFASGTALVSKLPIMIGGRIALEAAFPLGERNILPLRAFAGIVTSIGNEASASTQLYHAGFSGCFLWNTDAVALGPCTQITTGQLRASGRGFTVSKEASAFWLSVAAGIRAQRALGSWGALSASVSMVLPATQVRLIEERTRETVAQTGSVAAEFELGLQVFF